MSPDLFARDISSQAFSSHQSIAHFASPDLSSDNWSIYRTRFLVRAKRLTQPLTFTDPLGRQHHGEAGDYLVQSSEGLLRIAPKEIFEDVYVILEPELSPPPFASARLDSQVRPEGLSA